MVHTGKLSGFWSYDKSSLPVYYQFLLHNAISILKVNQFYLSERNMKTNSNLDVIAILTACTF
jgi:hypothetical protein